MEIDENQEYIERENEFEEELSDEDTTYQTLPEDLKKKVKLAKKDIDVETFNNYHLCNYAQVNGLQLGQEKGGFTEISSYIPVLVSP